MMNLWLIPGANEEAYRNLPKTMAKPISEERLQKAGLDEAGSEYYAWGTRKGKNEVNVGKWQNMRPDDVCLFYTQDLSGGERAYHWVAKIVDTERSPKLSSAFWDDPEFELVYFLDKPKEINISVQSLSKAFSRYRENYFQRAPMGFTRVDPNVVSSINVDYGSLEGWIENVLSGHEDGNDTVEFVKSFLVLQKRIKEWSDAFISGNSVAIDVASRTGHWYYSPIYDTFGPSKFIGYDNISLEEYNPNELDGRDTEQAINKLKEYSLLKDDQPDFQIYQKKLNQFLSLKNKKQKSNAQIHISEKLEIRRLMFQLHLAREIFSYKYVMLHSLIQNVNDATKSTHEYFWEYYRDRKKINLPPDKEESAISKVDLEQFNRGEISSILDAPFEAINNSATNQPIILKKDTDYCFSQNIIDELKDHKQELIDFINFKLNQYFKESGVETLNFWWVNQGKSFQKAKEEGSIWAPKENRRGKTEFHWKNVYRVKKGDIIFNYANRKIRAVSIAQSDGYENIRTKSSSNDNWGEEGWRADLSYYEITPPIPVEDIGSSIAKLNLKYGPIDRTGGANQGYLFKLNKEAVKIISDKLSLKSLPTDIKNRIADQPNGGTMSETEIVNHIYNWMEKQGFVISKAELINFYCCLKTKPFVLLAGISGTGKTKLVRLFAEAVGATEENHRFQLIPVRPDWNDNSELLGFFDLSNHYQPGALIPLLVRAHANPNKPYFLCLDEMNLARVEHYFSDFLSIIESRRFHGEKVTTDQILSQEQMEKMNEENLDEEVKSVLIELKSHQVKGIGLPENLYVIGTVNMDETTHPFSRKVLDRANTIEFSDIHLTKGLTITQDHEKPNELNLGNNAFRAKYLTMIDLLKVDQDIPKEISERLNNLNDTLSKAGCQIGYRVRDEAAFYMKNVIEIEHSTLGKEAGFERVILQKILPRLQGSSYQIKAVLEDLLKQYDPESREFNYDDEGYTAKMQTLIENKGPLVKKIGNMLIQFMEDGFTSFWAN
jgi:5-methylcytosine-specific restriction enzyme B